MLQLRTHVDSQSALDHANALLYGYRCSRPKKRGPSEEFSYDVGEEPVSRFVVVLEFTFDRLDVASVFVQEFEEPLDGAGRHDLMFRRCTHSGFTSAKYSVNDRCRQA